MAYSDPYTNVIKDSSSNDGIYRAFIDYATTGNLNATYSNGTQGVGATLTNAGVLAAFSVDNASPTLNQLILVKNQSLAARNGIYTVTTVGSGSVAWVLTRWVDYNEGTEILQGDAFFINGGQTQAGTVWVLTSAAPFVIGTTALNFTAQQVAGLGTASTKTATDNTKTYVASVDGAATVGNLAQYADILGTIEDGPGYSSTSTASTIVQRDASGNFSANIITATLSGQASSVATGAIVDAMVNATAGINATKIGAGSVDNTELGYLNGVTSSVQTQLNGKASLTGATYTGAVILDGDPSTNLQAATKEYVDQVAGGLDTYNAVNVSSTANLVGVYVNGTAGVGATFTMTATGVQTLDGQTVTAGLRYVFRYQDNEFENGIYDCTVAGAIGVASVFTRSTDFDESSEIVSGKLVSVLIGTLYEGYLFRNVADNPVIGTDPITFTVFYNPSNFLQRSNNLGDLNSVPAALTNLGIGTAGLQNSNAVSLTGGVITGLSELGAYAPVSSSLECDSNGILNFIGANSAGLLRYGWGANSAEAGSNTGYNPCLFLYDDAGTYLSTAFEVNRATGDIGFNFDITAANLSGSSSGTNTGDKPTFTQIAVSGQTTVTASTAGTPLTLVAGSNITLTTNNTAKTVTVAAAGGSSGNLVRFDATVTAAQLNFGIATLFVTNGVSYRILNLWINGTDNPFNGGGGNEGILITDGTTQYAFGNSSSVTSGLNSVWGSSTLIFPLAGVPINTPTNSAPNSNIIAAYWPGTGINYSGGEIVISGLLQQV